MTKKLKIKRIRTSIEILTIKRINLWFSEDKREKKSINNKSNHQYKHV